MRLADFRGKVVAVDFIYTRCPLPDVCPRLAANFAALQRRFRDRLGSELMLLSVTVDPEYDTPAVLADYAKPLGRGRARVAFPDRQRRPGSRRSSAKCTGPTRAQSGTTR